MEENRKMSEERRVEELVDALEGKDRLISTLVAEKERLLAEIQELHNEINNIKWGYNG
jgi:predicted house-cleaning noncanonical NTP pyrophosphatase (MazG superfamily)